MLTHSQARGNLNFSRTQIMDIEEDSDLIFKTQAALDKSAWVIIGAYYVYVLW